MTKTALILGATGRFGRNAGEAFEAAGWTVHRFKRGNDLAQAAQGADIIVNAWNPPYPDWAKQVPGLTRDVIAAAKSSGATVIIPGNVYVYGQGAPALFGPSAAQTANNPLGRIRRDMEAAYEASGVRTIVLRAGDFLDTERSGNWFDAVITKDWRKGKFTYPGPMDRVHAWAFLPDITRAMVELAEMRDRLPDFADIPFEGYSLNGEEIRALVETAGGVPQKHKTFPWWVISLVRPVWRVGRGIYEMRYLWSKPHRLDPAPLAALLPDFQPTPANEAIAAALVEPRDKP